MTFVAISHASLSKLEAFERRMGWSFKWLSAEENGFNYDYNVAFKPEVISRGEAIYNYELATRSLPLEHAAASEHAGMSVFYKNSQGEMFHTYFGYARGLDALNTAISGSIGGPRGATRTPSPSRCPGCAITISTRPDRHRTGKSPHYGATG